jgi:sugar phosphate isomerase/epimerase
MEDCLRLAKGAGFAGIDVDVNEAATLVVTNGINYVRDLFAEEGMKIGGWIWFDHFGFSEDEISFGDEMKTLPELARVAEAIGASRVLSWILPYSDSLEFKQNFDLHVKRIRSAMEVLNDHGQKLALEYIGPRTFREGHRYEFIHTLHGALELIDAVNSPNLGLIMDSWHWYTSGSTLEEIRALPGNLAVYVHLSDAPEGIPVDEQVDHIRCLPGSTGVIDNAGFLKTLHAIGYKGPVTAEPFSDEIKALPARAAASAAARALLALFDQAGLRQ